MLISHRSDSVKTNGAKYSLLIHIIRISDSWVQTLKLTVNTTVHFGLE